MFYCDKCAKKNDLRETLVKSLGSCEICGDNRNCNDLKTIKNIPEHKVGILVCEKHGCDFTCPVCEQEQGIH